MTFWLILGAIWVLVAIVAWRDRNRPPVGWASPDELRDAIDAAVAASKPVPKPTVKTTTYRVVLRADTPSTAEVILPERRKSATLLQFIQRQKAASDDRESA